MRACTCRGARYPVVIPAVCLVLSAGCAHTGDGEARYRVEAREELKQLSCPPTTTAVCVERINQVTKCFCGSQETLEALLERGQ